MQRDRIAFSPKRQPRPWRRRPRRSSSPRRHAVLHRRAGNIIFQAHGPFHSPYEGTNSLLGRGEYKTSLIGTLYMGAELVRNPARHLEAIYDEESAGGRGSARRWGWRIHQPGCGGAPEPGPMPYLARVQVHQTIGFSSKDGGAERGPFSLATEVPERRLELRVGKMGLPDFFDLKQCRHR